MGSGASKTTSLHDVRGSGNAFLNSANNFTGDINHGNTTFNQTLYFFFTSELGIPDPRRSTLPRGLDSAQSRDIHCSSIPADPGCANKPVPTSPDVAEQDKNVERGRRKHLEIMTGKREEIVDVYNSLLDNCDEAATRARERHRSLNTISTISTIRSDISEQQIRFEVTSKFLLRAVSTAPIKRTELSLLLFAGVMTTLNEIHFLLSNTPRHVKHILREVEVGANFQCLPGSVKLLINFMSGAAPRHS